MHSGRFEHILTECIAFAKTSITSIRSM